LIDDGLRANVKRLGNSRMWMKKRAEAAGISSLHKQTNIPNALEDKLAQGLISHQRGRLAEAENIYGEILKQEPNNFNALHLLGIIAVQTNRAARGVELINKAIKINAWDAAAYSNLGMGLHALRRFEEALASYDQALALEPNDPEVYNNRGAVLRDLDRRDEARTNYETAIALKPNYAEPYSNRGNLLRVQGQYEDALVDYDKAIELKPDYAEAHIARGMVLRDLRRHDEALNSCDKAIALRPNYAEAYNARGMVLRDLNRHDEALNNCDEAIALKGDYAEAYSIRANILREIGDFEEMRKALHQAIALEPRRGIFYQNLSNYMKFTSNDRHLLAMEALTQEIDTLPAIDQCNLHFALGKAYADLHQHERSFRHLLAGNAVQRRLIDYDESTTLNSLARTAIAFNSEVMRTKGGLGHPSRVPIFITGMPRSGTTLVEQILASHPEVFGAGELMELSDAVAGVTMLKGDPAIYPEALAALSTRQLHEVSHRYLDSIAAYSPVTAARITDKMPANFRFVGLISLALPNARIIHTRRNPLDTCLSCFSILFGGNQPYTYDLSELGRYYRAYAHLMAHWHAVLPEGAMLEVKYENLVDNLEREARRIVAFCGLEWDDACLNFHETRRSVKTASASQVRQPIYRSSVDRWRPYEKMIEPLLDALDIDLAPFDSQEKPLLD
jgi:tetratricopeptide (TPR) repeat protein